MQNFRLEYLCGQLTTRSNTKKILQHEFYAIVVNPKGVKHQFKSVFKQAKIKKYEEIFCFHFGAAI